MTNPNKSNAYPDEAEIRCPRCGDRALFRRAFTLIPSRAWGDWASRLWPSARATNWMGDACWVPGDSPPSWNGWIVIQHDPGNHRWQQPSAGYTPTDEGTVSCRTCVARYAHTLRWPDDAWFRFGLRQGVLWAWSHEHAHALGEFIASDQRDPAAHGPYSNFLGHVPTHFLAATDRDEIVKRVRRRLEELGPR